MSRFLSFAALLTFLVAAPEAVRASQVQHDVCSQETHSESAAMHDADRSRIAISLRGFIRAAVPSELLSADQQAALTAGGVSYVYTSLVCATGSPDGSDFGVPHVGDTEHFPGTGAPNGSTMTVSSCASQVQLVVTYKKTDDGWVVTEVHQTHVAFCPLGN